MRSLRYRYDKRGVVFGSKDVVVTNVVSHSDVSRPRYCGGKHNEEGQCEPPRKGMCDVVHLLFYRFEIEGAKIIILFGSNRGCALTLPLFFVFCPNNLV